MFTKGLRSSLTPHWETPPELYEALNAEFGFTLDPCPVGGSDGLDIPWCGAVFVNPPYGRAITAWIRKGWESAQQGATVVMLVPSRTDTRWWHEYVMKGEIRFIKGRLKFSGSKVNAPFPSAVVVFRTAE